MDSLDSFVDTFSGLRFWPLDPNPDDILIADIAHALAHQCRFGGHASKFYSVAEHSFHFSRLCLPEHALWGLLHDASEAYLVDLPRPLKQLPEFAPYREAERRLQRAGAVRFGLPPDQPASVTEADDTMLWIEGHSLLDSAAVVMCRSGDRAGGAFSQPPRRCAVLNRLTKRSFDNLNSVNLRVKATGMPDPLWA